MDTYKKEKILKFQRHIGKVKQVKTWTSKDTMKTHFSTIDNIITTTTKNHSIITQHPKHQRAPRTKNAKTQKAKVTCTCAERHSDSVGWAPPHGHRNGLMTDKGGQLSKYFSSVMYWGRGDPRLRNMVGVCATPARPHPSALSISLKGVFGIYLRRAQTRCGHSGVLWLFFGSKEVWSINKSDHVPLTWDLKIYLLINI